MNVSHNPHTLHPPVSTYSHAVEVPPNARWLFISGQVALRPDGSMPDGFRAQCEEAWNNLFRVLAAAGMGRENLVKLTVFLVREEDLPVFREVRDRFLGDARPATTLLFVRALARPQWLIEIEGVAAAAPR
ncbi:MAG: RidA family protein [Armatimonadota bacterium]|nr:RidA family protein [Armatimonadota bacterium]